MSEWIEWKWTPEKPYPETLGTLVAVRMRCGEEHTRLVRQWHDVDMHASNWFQGDIMFTIITLEPISGKGKI